MGATLTDNREALDQAFAGSGEEFEVAILYDRAQSRLEITDNSIGMDEAELEEALKVAAHAPKPQGRSKYGMGLKTAACWYGNNWSIMTKKLGEDYILAVDLDVERIASGDADLDVKKTVADDPEKHFTKICICNLIRALNTRTLGKIRTFLASMYREDLRDQLVTILWQGAELIWDDGKGKWLPAPDGTHYQKDFAFEVLGKAVHGNIGVLETGSRALAGFSIFQNRRLIKGYPDSWRPPVLYGQDLGSNNLVYQRLVGEIHLADFEVSYTKDDIIWDGDEEDELQRHLYHACAEYRRVAADRRKGQDSRRPNGIQLQAAVNQVQAELNSDAIVDILNLTDLPPAAALDSAVCDLVEAEATREPTMLASLENLNVKVFVDDYLS